MRILLCEDEKQLANGIVAILKHNNYSVDVVHDGQSAIEYLEIGNFDAVILDIMMPKKDGLTVLKELRASGNNVPVIILTAKNMLDDKVKGLDLGANDYLTKPFETKELLARLRVATRGTVQNTSSVLEFGNITLNRATFELKTKSGSFILANKEFQMLEMMMINPKHLISSERFMEKIWGYDSESEINVVWVYISYLRKKFTSIKANVQIKVTRNTGYSLEEI